MRVPRGTVPLIAAVLATLSAWLVPGPAAAQRELAVERQIAALDRISEESLTNPLRRRAHLLILARTLEEDERALLEIDRSGPLGMVGAGGAFLAGGVALMLSFALADAGSNALCPRSLFRCERSTPDWVLATIAIGGGVALVGAILLVVGGGPLRDANIRIGRLRPRIERERYWLDILRHVEASASPEGGSVSVRVPF